MAKVGGGQATALGLTVDEDGKLRAQPEQLQGVQRLRIRGSVSVNLPDWFAGLSDLREIDVRSSGLARTVPLPSVQWALDADDLLSLDSVIEPSQVYALRLDPDTSEQVGQHLIQLATAGQLSLKDLTVAPTRRSSSLVNQWDLDSVLDDVIAACPAIEHLAVVTSRCKGISGSLRDRRRLRTLYYGLARLREVPSWIFELPELEYLALTDTGLTMMPQGLGRAVTLRALDLSKNPLAGIPEAVWQLPELTFLDVSGCPVAEIPAEILHLDRLWTLRVDVDNVTVPPPEVVGRGVPAIRSYWEQEQASGMDYLAEAKLLLVGEAGAGKTSLMRKILDPGYRLDPREESTQGIDVRDWRFPAVVRDHGERSFRVNIWDFGGQEIYHATHQFFLTKRSVYVLVSDGRREDTDFQYWLDIVNLLSDGSPLIVVQNRKQGRGQTLDIRVLRQGYPHVIEQLEVDLADNSGLQAVVDRARRELELLPHIGTPLPKSWKRVRAALERDPRDHIAADEFFRICRDEGFRQEEDMRQLGGFLHDLGICLFFQDDRLLRRTIILKPEWGTAAVYRLLDDKAISDAQGVFGPSDLDRLWPEPTYREMRDELVQLMVRFSLCYPVRDSDRYIAPQLLPPAHPGYVWEDEPDDMTLRYEYVVMPKGVVRRLIVALHKEIEDDLVWRHGVVFRFEQGRAEVVEDLYRRCLTIRLAGDLRVVLSLIDRELDTIHRAYPELRFDRLRPCACAACGAAPEPHMFRVRDLEDFARSGDQIQCRTSRKLVDPVALLSELWRAPSAADTPAPSSRPAEVFISYKWGGGSGETTDKIDARLSADGMRVLRDKRDIPYKESIERFMRRLGGGKFVVVVIDDAYLRSDSCMFELAELAGRSDFARCIYPVVLSDADIYRPVGRIGYIKYWEEKIVELETAMSGVSPQFLDGVRRDLDLYAKIRNTIAGITDVLRDMNTVRPKEETDGFAWLSKMIADAHTREAGV